LMLAMEPERLVGHEGQGLLDGEEGSADVGVEGVVELLLGDGSDGGGVAVTGAGEENIDAALLFFDLIEEAVEVGEVGGSLWTPVTLRPMEWTASSRCCRLRPVMKT